MLSRRQFAAATMCALATLGGCASTRQPMSVGLEALAITKKPKATEHPPVLTENHFYADRTTGLSESALREVLATPVFLERNARIGVVPVHYAYAPDGTVPLPAVPAALVEALEASGEFELATEISTDFPAHGGVAGLRELAARYRADYLLIYRHRFVDQTYLNPIAWGYATVIGALFLPGNTLECAGVLEATLFDVKTGTILFTVHERASTSERVNNFHHGIKSQALKKQLVEGSTRRLVDQVLLKVRRLVSARTASSDRALSSLGGVSEPSATVVSFTVPEFDSVGQESR